MADLHCRSAFEPTPLLVGQAFELAPVDDLYIRVVRTHAPEAHAHDDVLGRVPRAVCAACFRPGALAADALGMLHQRVQAHQCQRGCFEGERVKSCVATLAGNRVAL